jgi:hypothetical protein
MKRELSIKEVLAKLTRMMLRAVDMRLEKAERDFWQERAELLAKSIEQGFLR